jgi:K+-transporting ATPase ATPase A chain
MAAIDIFKMVLFIILVIGLAWPLGAYMERVFTGKSTLLDRIISPLEKSIYRVSGIDPDREMDWKEYTWALLLFNFLGMVLLFIMQLVQGHLPFNPQHFGAVKWDLAFNTAASFITNTNWQAYAGESTMSYFTQMAGLTVHNFLSAATGAAVAVALIRGLIRRQGKTLGNFWVDLTRTTLYILLPLALVFAFVLVSQGVIQNLSSYLTVTTLEGAKQTLALGPVASQESIKMLGTNGGGFFNANSAHPFENPSPFINYLQMMAMMIIPAAFVFTFGRMVKDAPQGRSILAAMLIVFTLSLGVLYAAEIHGNPQVQALGISSPTSMEGKEVRFGIADSSLFTNITTVISCGAVNNMHDSLTPLGGLIPLFNIMLGEVIFGGVGAGLYGILMYVILTVFIIGLMVGRTPEYLGKKIEARETRMATVAVLISPAVILLGAGIAAVTQAGVSSVLNPGPHGLSEIIYAFTSAAGNNGSAFAGLSANTVFYNVGLGLTMLIGRFGVIVPVLALAGSMVEKKVAPAGPGTFQTTGALFTLLLIAVILIVGALTFFPALALGPIVEHLLMLSGTTF